MTIADCQAQATPSKGFGVGAFSVGRFESAVDFINIAGAGNTAPIFSKLELKIIDGWKSNEKKDCQFEVESEILEDFFGKISVVGGVFRFDGIGGGEPQYENETLEGKEKEYAK